MINDETGAVTFPEARQGAIAAADYVNNYLDGINGHPIQIDSCIGDGTAGHRRPLREPAGGRPPDRDPRRGRRRRPGLDPDLRARQPGLPRRHPVHPGAGDRVRTRSSSGRSASATTPPPPSTRARSCGVKSVAIMYFSNAQGESILPADHARRSRPPGSPRSRTSRSRRPRRTRARRPRWSRAAAPSWSTSTSRTAAATC